MSRPARAGSAGKPVTIRATDAERERWEAAAVCLDMRLSDWARYTLDGGANRACSTFKPERWGAAMSKVRRRRR